MKRGQLSCVCLVVCHFRARGFEIKNMRKRGMECGGDEQLWT